MGFAVFLTLAVAAVPGAAADQRDDAVLRRALAEALTETGAGGGDRYATEVWLADMSRRLEGRVRDAAERLEILRAVAAEAQRAGLPPEMILAVIDVESGFQRYAVSRANAQGLMQVMRFWLDEFGLPGTALFDVQQNVRMGCTILRYYYDLEKGNWTRALGRYNGSLGRRDYPAKVFERLRTTWYRA